MRILRALEPRFALEGALRMGSKAPKSGRGEEFGKQANGPLGKQTLCQLSYSRSAEPIVAEGSSATQPVKMLPAVRRVHAH